MALIGIDIGTTELGIAAVDADRHVVLATRVESHGATLPTGSVDEHCQDADRLCDLALKNLADFETHYGRPQAIAVTGQMHGILYLDQAGRPISPLYTWMDRRADRRSGDQQPEDGISFVEEIERRSGWRLAAGYGVATHYVNRALDLVPKRAHSLATIMDYLSMRLCRNTIPISDPTCAASIGCFRAPEGFDRQALRALQLEHIHFPKIVPSATVIGHRADGVPVVAPIGDNQAGFIGTVSDPDKAILINIGTSAQISVASRSVRQVVDSGVSNANLDADLEPRPFVDDRSLLVGSLLVGGRAMEMLADLFAEAYSLYSGSMPVDKYAFLGRLASSEAPQRRLAVDIDFAGTRMYPQRRGAIGNVSVDNLTVAGLVNGFTEGMAEKLYALWRRIAFRPEFIAGSGGALRRNRSMQAAVAAKWGLPLRMPTHAAEASVGAALAAAVGIGATWKEIGRTIRYHRH